MPTSRRTAAAALDLPTVYRLVTLREVGDAFAHAIAIAPREGAGTLVYVGRFDLAEFAVVLEPDEPLRTARRAFYAGCNALAAALAAYAPPEKPIAFLWPDAIHVDGGLIGGTRLAWPTDAAEDEPADWLVFGGMIRTVALEEDQQGFTPAAAALDAEGFADADSGRLVESFARHLMAAVDTWHERGFRDIAARYLLRLAPEKGAHSEIDDNGDLLIRRAASVAVERRALTQALDRPSWLDPATGGPRR